MKKAQEFLVSKKQVKVTVQLRGRQRSNPQQGIDMLNRVLDDLSEYGTIARKASPESLMIVLNPKRH